MLGRSFGEQRLVLSCRGTGSHGKGQFMSQKSLQAAVAVTVAFEFESRADASFSIVYFEPECHAVPW